MIIAGDIGGTKTVLALYSLEAGKLKHVKQAVFPSKGPKSLEEILEKFLVDEKIFLLKLGVLELLVLCLAENARPQTYLGNLMN